MKALLLESIHPHARKLLSKAGFQVEHMSESLEEARLIERLAETNPTVLEVRSKTRVSAKALEHAPALEVVAAFCVGTEKIDLEACGRRGIPVFHDPFSNTRSVAELVIGEIIMLCRRVFDKSQAMHESCWNKTSNDNYEVRGKKLGIVGYGKIGSQVLALAEVLGMEVYHFDTVKKLTLGTARKCNSLEELLAIADVVTIHVDGKRFNRNLFGQREFQLMRGRYFLNMSRGFVVDLEALRQNLVSGKLKGAAIDVWPTEPKESTAGFANPLQGLPNVILTPHDPRRRTGQPWTFLNGQPAGDPLRFPWYTHRTVCAKIDTTHHRLSRSGTSEGGIVRERFHSNRFGSFVLRAAYLE